MYIRYTLMYSFSIKLFILIFTLLSLYFLNRLERRRHLPFVTLLEIHYSLALLLQLEWKEKRYLIASLMGFFLNNV